MNKNSPKNISLPIIKVEDLLKEVNNLMFLILLYYF